MAINVFISYSSVDDAARRALEMHLSALKKSGLIRTWTDHRVTAGQDWRAVAEEHLDAAELILLLVSPDFLACDYCHDVQMKRAVERHHARVVRVVPIIVRHVDWTGTLIHGLKVLPAGGRPVTSTGWDSHDKAWTNVALGLRAIVDEMLGHAPSYSSSGAQSFVAGQEGNQLFTPHPGAAPSFVSTSPRAPPVQSPLAFRPPERSLPEIVIPPPPPRSSSRRGSWAAPEEGASKPPLESRAYLLVSLLGAGVVAAVLAGVWAVNRPAAPESESPPRESPTLSILPSPQPAPTRPPDPEPVPAPTLGAPAEPCCGGVACAPALQDTKDSYCAKRLPDHCATCPSQRAKVDGACRDPIAPSQRFLLRFARLDLSGAPPATTRVCVRLSGDTLPGWQCTYAIDGADVHLGFPGAEMSTRLPVSTADLLASGQGLDIAVEVDGRITALLKAAHWSDGQTLRRSALCVGVGYNVGGAHIAFYLDDP